MNLLAWNAVLLLLSIPQAPAATGGDAVRLTDLVKQVQQADYEGNRTALAKLHEDMAPFAQSPKVRSRVEYWRGFALWRRAINGFNEGAAPAELERDLVRAIDDFRAAVTADPTFSDAKVGEASCLVNLSFLKMNSDSARAREWFLQSATALDAARKANPDNPRLLWVQGANQWYAPPERGGGQAAALATYEKGLKIARSEKPRDADPLDPHWGEPELLMNLAFAHLNAATPNPVLAEKYAREALALVPYWHYVGNTLLPQIQKAKGQSGPGGKWTGVEQGRGDVTYPVTLELVVNGEDTTGTVSIGNDPVKTLANGKVQGTIVTFTTPAMVNGREITITWRGELKDDRLTFTRRMAGGPEMSPLSLQRAAS